MKKRNLFKELKHGLREAQDKITLRSYKNVTKELPKNSVSNVGAGHQV